jgi:myo-inositol-1(or 4)-monophosphatase
MLQTHNQLGDDMTSHADADERFETILATAHALADLAGRAILPHFRSRLAVENKAKAGRFDPVTEADRAAEAAIRAELARRHPGHGVLGEEMENEPSASRYQWIIDPVDGTRAFIMGLPVWGTLIGLAHDGKPLLGVLDQPYTGERFWSTEGRSLMRDRGGERSIATRPCAGLAEAILTCTTPEMFKPAELGRFQALAARARMTRYGGDCYAYAMLAMGGVDLVVEAGLKTFDTAALIPIIERAGGRITDWQGGPALGAAQVVAAGDARVHAAALAVLGGG